MKKRIFQLAIILLLSVTVNITYGQDRRTTDTKVADALAQMPAGDLMHLERVLGELVTLGPEGFQKISQMLVPAGTGDDTAARFAINSLARYASAFGRTEPRQLTEAGLIAALESHKDAEVRTFLFNQLNLVGGYLTVKTIIKYLAEEELTEPAAQTLVAIGSPEAAKALMQALAGAGDASRTTLVRSLGELRCDEAARSIGSFLGSGNPGLRSATLAALANIGNPGSYKLLLKEAKSEGFRYEPAGAAEAFITYAGRLGERGELKLCKSALQVVMKENRDAGKLHNHAAALSLYAKYFDDEVMPLLLSAVGNSNKEFRYAVLNVAQEAGGASATRQWIAKAGTVPAATKAEIIDMLGRRGDRQAIGFVRANLNDASAGVREDAIGALVKLQGTDAVPVLIDHLAKGNDAEAAKTALLQLLSRKHLAPVAARMKDTSGATKAAFIDLVAAKGGTEYFGDIFALTKSQNADERNSAYRALKNISTPAHLDALIGLLSSVTGENEVQQVQQAVVAAAKDVEKEKTEQGKLLTALRTSGNKERIIAILPETGGDAALKTVSEYFSSSSGALKEAAFEALTGWKDYQAAASLYKIAESSQGDYRTKAVASFVRQVRSADLTDDQKLLQYRKIMPFASGVADQRLVIGAIGNLKTFLSLVYLEQYLQKPELQQVTARAIMRIALPDSDGLNGFSGDKVRELLQKVSSVITGDESDYDKINIKNYLDRMPKEEGFVSLFNGKNLDGWQGLVGNPITRAKMGREELAKKQAEANRKMTEFWAVRDNTIVFNGNGDNLCTVKEYSDFEMVVDWRITKDGDSGLYLRGTPQVQIWDTARTDVGAEVGSGGLYNNQKNPSKPLKVADNPIGEWNTFRITMIGENVTVYLNGELVVDNVPLENYWDRNMPIFEKGFIELQAHGTDLAFRDIYVKEIRTNEIGLTEEEKAEGFVSLFNGMNLNGWQGNKTDYFASNGELVVQPARGGHGNLFTEKEYSDFIFRFEFQLTPGANNGLGIRAPLTGDAAYAGMELQILDNTAPIYANLEEYQYHGSVYGVIPAKRGYLKPVGEWNVQEVVAKGSRITITLNGTVILDGDLVEASRNGTIDKREHPGLLREKGYIGFLGHGSELKFRNIRVKDLGR